jgi:hypothetical protein
MGPFGGEGGQSLTSATCQSGFSSAQLQYPDTSGYGSFGGIVLDCAGSPTGIEGYADGVDTHTFTCPAGEVLQSVRGTTKGVVISLQFSCTSGISGVF